MHSLRERLANNERFKLKPAPSADQIAAIRALHTRIPGEYLALLTEADGGEGWVGENYLQLWPSGVVVEVTNANRGSWRLTGVEHLVFIGGDGGGETLVLDLREAPPTIVLLNTCCEHLYETPWRLGSLSDVHDLLETASWFDEGAK